MLLREIIDMTKEKPVSLIARDHLEIGEKKLREILKRMGATNQRGQRGWIFQGNPDHLERSVYDFVQDGRKAKARTNEQKHEIAESQANIITGETIIKNTKQQANIITKKRASFDIDIEILKKIKHYAVEEDLKISEVVEDILFSFFNQK